VNSARRTLLVLDFLVALGPFTVDLYIPAFPLVQADFGTSATAVQFTLTATTIGFALGQLAIGPWSDSIGRRRPLLVAVSVGGQFRTVPASRFGAEGQYVPGSGRPIRVVETVDVRFLIEENS
jgi:MFS family permease